MELLDLGARFLDPLSLAIVAGGSLIVAALRSTRSDVARAFAALGPLLRARPEREAQAARVAINRIKAIAQLKGLVGADRVPTAEAFLRRAAARLADDPDPVALAGWGAAQLEERAIRHAAVHDYWRAAADAAPAMGMIGTIIGLIEMFAHMDDPAKIGPGMALALLTTLYGVVFANVMFGPIAARLERLSALEMAWQREAVTRLAALAAAEAEALPAGVARAAPRSVA